MTARLGTDFFLFLNTGLQQHNATSYSLLTKDLDVDQQSLIMSILANADAARQQPQQS
jgi:hypothetical protein